MPQNVVATHFSSKIFNKILLHYALQSSTFISKHSTWGNRLHNLIRKFSFPRIYFMTLSFSSKIFLFWFHPLPMLCQTISMPSEVNAFLKNPNQPGARLQIGTIMVIQIGGQILECIAACVGCINVVKCHNKNSSYFQINSNHLYNSNVPLSVPLFFLSTSKLFTMCYVIYKLPLPLLVFL